MKKIILILSIALISAVSFGLCYSYFSAQKSVSGEGGMANVDVEYQYPLGNQYYTTTDIYGTYNDSEIQKLNDILINPGDSIEIVGRAVNVSNVPVYFLVKLEVIKTLNGNQQKEVVWYNIGSNDPQVVNDELQDETPNEEESIEIVKANNRLNIVNMLIFSFIV